MINEDVQRVNKRVMRDVKLVSINLFVALAAMG